MTGSGISAEQRSTVIEIWRETLAVSEIDLDRGFADLGGTSLAANRLTAELSRQLGVDLPVIRVFEYPTLRLLLRYLGNGPGADPLPDAPAAVSQDSSLSEVADA